jgi:hypothetical protein
MLASGRTGRAESGAREKARRTASVSTTRKEYAQTVGSPVAFSTAMIATNVRNGAM